MRSRTVAADIENSEVKVGRDQNNIKFDINYNPLFNIASNPGFQDTSAVLSPIEQAVLRELRRPAGVSRGELADALNLRPNTAGDVVAGRLASPF